MNLLILTPQRPYPTHQGTTIRNFYIIAELAKRHQISLLTFLEADQSPQDDGPLPDLCRTLDILPAPARSTLTRLKQIAFTNRPDMSWRLWSLDFDRKLRQLLQENAFDVVQIEGIEMSPYLPTIKELAPQTKIIYDDHNAEWLLQYRNFTTDLQNPARWIAAAYSFIQTQRLKRYERRVCRQADGVIAVSEADKEAILQLDPALKITLVPNGVDLKLHSQHPAQSIPVDLVFTGKMDYRPNIDAMLWFGQEVLPLIQKERPQTTLAIVGQRPHPRLDPLRENRAITITGYVDDVRPYIAGASVYIAPFRVGGGTRLKLLEAMAMRKSIVATGVGAEGFPITNNKEMILVDDPALMTKAILRLLDNPQIRHELGKNAYQFVSTHYAWESLVPAMEALYKRKG
jgi:sugar transferase (PEP-CTERM/EpsH1 system associated)